MTLARGLDLLKTLATQPNDGLAVQDICTRLNAPRVSVHRLLANLMMLGWVERDDARRYHLGVAAWRGGVRANRIFDLANLASSSLDAIETELEDTTFLLRRNGAEATCIARREGTYLLKFLVMDGGVSYPMGVGAGSLAILAHLSPEEFEQTLKVTERKLKSYPRTNLELIRSAAEETRRRGFAVTNGFIVASAAAVAVAIFDHERAPIGSLACVAAPERFEGERLNQVVGVLQREADNIMSRIASPTMRRKPGASAAVRHARAN